MWIWVIVHYSWLQNTQCWGQCELKQNIHRLILHTSNYQLTRGTLPSNHYQICTAAVMTHMICHTQHEVTTFVHIYKHVSSTYLCSYITAMSAWINRRNAGGVKVAFHLVTILQCSVSENQMLSCNWFYSLWWFVCSAVFLNDEILIKPLTLFHSDQRALVAVFMKIFRSGEANVYSVSHLHMNIFLLHTGHLLPGLNNVIKMLLRDPGLVLIIIIVNIVIWWNYLMSIPAVAVDIVVHWSQYFNNLYNKNVK